MDTVNFKLTSCEACPNMKAERYYTEDSFEHCYEWKCMIAGDCLTPGRRISYQDTFDKAPPIPKWCPLREKE